MAIHFPERKYLNFAELQSRWQAEPNDIRAAVVSGALKASMYVKEEVTFIEWVPNESRVPIPRLVVEPLLNDHGGELQLELCGWFYLQEPRETGPLDCKFRLISIAPRPDKESGPKLFEWLSLDHDVSLSEIEEKGVFMLTEIARFESEHGSQPSTPLEQENPLQTRERNSLLIIIALLTEAAGLDLDANSKTAGIIESAAAEKGLTLSRRAIDNHLKRARETVPTRSK